MEGRTKSPTMTWSKFKSYYLCLEGQTKPPTSVLVQNLSPSTYGWKDEPSHPWVLCQNLSLSTHGWKDERSHLRVSWSKFNSFYLQGGRMNRVTYGCLGRSIKSNYLRVNGLTKQLASAMVQNLSPSIYGWRDEPSHLRCLGRSLSPTTYGWKE